MNFNSVTLVGRLTKKPEGKIASNGKTYCPFIIAVNRRRSSVQSVQETDFINCFAWDNVANYLTSYLDKGNLILVQGRLQVRTVEQNGISRIFYDVIADQVQALEPKSSNLNKPNNTTDYQPRETYQQTASLSDTEVEEDSPF